MATAEAGAKESASGMPQLAFETFPNQIFWLMVALVVIFFVLNRVALPRIGSTIEERHDAIENDLERAAEYRRKAEEAEQAYDKALADARAEAQRIAGEAKAEIQKDVDAAIAKADAEIAEKSAESEARIREIRDSAMEAVEAVAKDTAGAIVEAVMPSAADADALNAAVSAQLKS
ncbi:MAG: F0F1 ATP synthase subunit B' [Pseudomonadota bacterium]